MKMFSIHDAKAGAFMQPFFARANGEAIRHFTVQANDPNSMICRFPGDFTLCYIGEFDEHVGQLAPAERQALGLASDFKSQQEMDV